jgi:hypothetical protein
LRALSERKLRYEVNTYKVAIVETAMTDPVTE